MGLSKLKTMKTLVTTFAGSEQPGTPAYKAPELDTGSASTMSDMWSLSCTLVELFIEDCVWRSDMDEKDIKQQKIKRMEPDGLKTFLQLNISNDIKDTVRKGLSYLPLERPTALEMLAKFLG
jgi:serine/threonine protein kinase